MDFSNTKRALASISSSLTELEKARVQYRSEIDQLSDQDYRRRYSEEAQVEDRSRINETFRARLGTLVPSLRKSTSLLYDAFEKDTHPASCERDALNSCLAYLSITKAAFDMSALESLMMPIIENKDFNSYFIVYKTCTSFFEGNSAGMRNFPHSEILELFVYWDEFKSMIGHVKKHIDNLIDPDTIPLGCTVIECGDQREPIAYVEMLKNECIPELENPQNLISHKDPVLSIGFSMDGFKRVR